MFRVERMDRPVPQIINETHLIAGAVMNRYNTIPNKEQGIELDPSTQAEYLNRPLTITEKASIGAVISRSGIGSYKSTSLKELLGVGDERRTMHPSFTSIEEEVPESRYNARDSLQKSPKYIAGVKAYAGRRYPQKDKRQRFEAVYADVQRALQTEGAIRVNETGTVFIWRGQDIVTGFIGKDGVEHRLLKPKTADKEVILQDLITLFDSAQTDSSGDSVQCVLRGADAVYEAVYDTGVVCELSAHLDMQKPSPEFLECWLFGIQRINSNSSKSLQDMAALFVSIYNDRSASPPETNGLRGWTPAEGVPNPETVNAGFMFDSAFVQDLLVKNITFDDGTTFARGDEGFKKAQETTVSLVRGGALSFNSVTRTLLDILRRKVVGEEIPEAYKDSRFLDISHDLQTAVKEDSFGGKWYDVSTQKGVFPVDTDDLNSFALAMLADRGMLQ